LETTKKTSIRHLGNFALLIGLAAALISFNLNQNKKKQTSQKDLDAATTKVKLMVTGEPYAEASISHDGRQVSADSSYRDVFTNLQSAQVKIKPGTIFTKLAYARKSDGTKGKLLMLFAMIKRDKGYFADGGDWEYATIPYDQNNDYKIHPNGMLPEKEDNVMRGKLTACGGCHKKAAGNDFVFTN
jgi:hypothetical protein